MEKAKKGTLYEWGCRILLTVHLWLAASGYIAFLQAKYQLVTPLIPQSTILIIIEPSFYSALCMAVSFGVALWLYFFKQRLAVMIVCLLSILSYEFLLSYFV